MTQFVRIWMLSLITAIRFYLVLPPSVRHVKRIVVMSRHRNIRNLEHDYYDEDDGYYDDDEYYLEQHRAKERKQKEQAANRVKQNKLKQQQQKQGKAAQTSEVKNTEVKGTRNKNTKTVGKKGPNVGKTASSNCSGISVAIGPMKSREDGVQLSSRSTELSVELSKVGGSSSCHGKADITSSNLQQIPPNILSFLHSSQLRSHLSMVILGHVDAGKSTLTGQLLLKLGHVDQRLFTKYQRQAASIGKSSFSLAWFTDEDDSERERGVTMDVATKFVRTTKHDFTILDAPGHKDFIPNMISGAASADCALLVVAATTGEFEAGFASNSSTRSEILTEDLPLAKVRNEGGQTREHIILSRGLGVSQVVVAVNKLDAAEPPWSQERFEHICSRLSPFLQANGFSSKRVTFVPVGGLAGVNITEEKKDKEGAMALEKWYRGPTLIEALDSFVPSKREYEKPLRLIVTDVSSEGKYATIRGRIIQGYVHKGESVIILPVGDEASIVRIERGRAAKEVSIGDAFKSVATDAIGKDIDDLPGIQNCALAGDTVEVAFSGIDSARLSSGCVVSHLSLQPKVMRRFTAKILVMDHLVTPIIRGSRVLIHMHSIDIPAVLNKLISSKKRRDVKTKLNPRYLSGGLSATVEITASERLVLEEYTECKPLGRFVLRRGGDTIAVGLIEKVLGP